jgi:hypothetical protein
MENTGIGRRSAKDFTPKQKRSISPHVVDRSPKCMSTTIQHFSGEFLFFVE